MKMSLLSASALGIALTASGCATTGGQPMTTNQRILSCVAMVGGGAGVGALLGGDDRGQGAMVGALLGGATCGVWLAFQHEADQERLRLAQSQAAQSGQAHSDAWVTQTGRAAQVSVTAAPASDMLVETSAGAQEARYCRSLNTSANVDGRAETQTEVWCRGADGQFAPLRDAQAVLA